MLYIIYGNITTVNIISIVHQTKQACQKKKKKTQQKPSVALGNESIDH